MFTRADMDMTPTVNLMRIATKPISRPCISRRKRNGRFKYRLSHSCPYKQTKKRFFLVIPSNDQILCILSLWLCRLHLYCSSDST